MRVVAGDAGAPAAWWDGRPFDRILADAPCTASGVVRRHPDGKWLRREADIASFARQQARLLDALWPCLARDGLLLYATCSVFREENEAQIDAFLARHADALRESLTFPPGVVHRGRATLAFAPGREPQSGRVFLRAASQGVTGATRRAWPRAPMPTVPRSRVRRPACRHAPCDPPPRALPDLGVALAGRRRVRRLAALVPPARADTIAVKSAELRAEDDGYVLNAEFDLTLNPTLEEALQKGVPLYFLLEFEISRPRWYWLDEKVLSSRSSTGSRRTR